MANEPAAPAADQRAASDPLKNAESDKRMDAFKASPDPWTEAAKMPYGGDRTHASGLQTLIYDADPSQYPALEKKLIATLTGADSTDCGREFACRMLRLIGSAAAVPELAKLLAVEKTSDMARYALESIPGAEVDAALKAALEKLTGRTREGLAGTIAARAAVGGAS